MMHWEKNQNMSVNLRIFILMSNKSEKKPSKKHVYTLSLSVDAKCAFNSLLNYIYEVSEFFPKLLYTMS